MKKAPTLYLAHNFNTRKTIRKWEIKMEGKYNISLDSPFYNNVNRAADMKILDSLEDGSREQKKYLQARDASSIVEDDLDKIRKSDGIVALANDTRIGTPMEIFFAARILRIPVYIITKKYCEHPWIKQHATKIFRNKREFERFVEKKWGTKK